MASMNNVVLVGHLGQDPEMRETKGGTAVANLSVATTNPYDRDKTEWHRVTLWGQSAEFAGKYARKGSSVAVKGRLEYSKWTDDDGNKRVTAQINGDNFALLDKRGSSGGSSSSNDDEDLPF